MGWLASWPALIMCSQVPACAAHACADEPWSSLKWTVFRGVAYDLTDFIPRHPAGALLASCARAALTRAARAGLAQGSGPASSVLLRDDLRQAHACRGAATHGLGQDAGAPCRLRGSHALRIAGPGSGARVRVGCYNPTLPNGAGAWLVKLAVGRDCTALFESYHLRPEVRPRRLCELTAHADPAAASAEPCLCRAVLDCQRRATRAGMAPDAACRPCAGGSGAPAAAAAAGGLPGRGRAALALPQRQRLLQHAQARRSA